MDKLIDGIGKKDDQIERQMVRQKDRWLDRQVDGQIERQMVRQKDI